MKDTDRLAFIRTQNEMWRATNPEAETWDTTYLLRIIEELKKKLPQHGVKMSGEGSV